MRSIVLTLAVFALVALAPCGAIPAAAQPGSLDTSFGTDGIFYQGASFPGNVYAMARHTRGTDEGLVFVSSAGYVARLTAAGQPDTAGFGNAQGQFALPILPEDVAVDSSQRIVIVGSYGSPARFGVVRLCETQGTWALDSTFGGGLVVTAVVSGACSAGAVAIQPDGYLVVAGTAYVKRTYGFAVARYDTFGNLDSTFGEPIKKGSPVCKGYLVDDIDTKLHEFVQRGLIALQPDAGKLKILVAGYRNDYYSAPEIR